MRGTRVLGSAVALSTIAVIAVGVSTAQAPNTVTKARYWMDAETTSGMMAAAANPMAMLTGRGGDTAARSLTLRLGTTQAPAGGGPKADHFMPPAAALGVSVPLLNSRATADTSAEPFERPKGRLRIFWGCGTKAGPGQPVVIDFARMSAGQIPPDLFATSITSETGPTAGNSRTFGQWPATRPGERSKTLSARSSLRGAHRIASNYGPEIKFDLTQDFMPALRARASDAPGGAVNLSWQPVTGATGYYANVIGSPGDGRDRGVDVVWWASSATRAFGGGLANWLSPATVNRLIGQKIVMPPSQTSCTIPAEVKAATGEAMITFLTAYGPEADFAYPPRPANATAAWRPEWTAKARFRATTTVIPGMEEMMSGGEMEDADQPTAAPKKKCKRRGGLGGMLGGALGVPTDC